MYKKLYKAVLADTTAEQTLTADRAAPILPDGSPLESLIPRCYLTNAQGPIADKADRLSEGTLFYIFYNHCGEAVQKEAYSRLLRMGWMFNREMNAFFQIVKRLSGADAAGEPAQILLFDYCSWSKATLDIPLDARFMENVERGDGAFQ